MTENDWFFNIFPSTPPKGSANCPNCGRFAKVIRVVNDASPLSAEEGYYRVVNCKQCGLGDA